MGEQVAAELRDVAPGAGEALGGNSSVARPSPAAIASAAARMSVGIGDAEHREHVVGLDPLAAVGDQLVERAERVAEAARGRARDRGDRAIRDLDRLGGGDAAHDLGDLLGRGR